MCSFECIYEGVVKQVVELCFVAFFHSVYVLCMIVIIGNCKRICEALSCKSFIFIIIIIIIFIF
jgi:hypothetical protein